MLKAEIRKLYEDRHDFGQRIMGDQKNKDAIEKKLQITKEMLLKEKHENKELIKKNREMSLKCAALEDRQKNMQSEFQRITTTTLNALAK